jgi:hypothetical protein
MPCLVLQSLLHYDVLFWLCDMTLPLYGALFGFATALTALCCPVTAMQPDRPVRTM